MDEMNYVALLSSSAVSSAEQSRACSARGALQVTTLPPVMGRCPQRTAELPIRAAEASKGREMEIDANDSLLYIVTIDLLVMTVIPLLVEYTEPLAT
jgi:hypothetical protein